MKARIDMLGIQLAQNANPGFLEVVSLTLSLSPPPALPPSLPPPSPPSLPLSRLSFSPSLLLSLSPSPSLPPSHSPSLPSLPLLTYADVWHVGSGD